MPTSTCYRQLSSSPHGSAIDHGYDAMGRLHKKHWYEKRAPTNERPDGWFPLFGEQWNHNRDGPLTGALTDVSAVQLTRDKGGRIIHETQSHKDGWKYTVSHQRNALGNIARTRHDEFKQINKI
jgi:hypothetical protein